MFVTRTIIKGRVKIKGKWFYPSDQFMKYDGRLDGQRVAFGLYPAHMGKMKQYTEYVAMWGSEKEWEDSKKGIHTMRFGEVNGTIPWYWWYTKKEMERKRKIPGILTKAAGNTK